MVDYSPGLNQSKPLGDRLAVALDGARRLEFAVAYAKTSGVTRLLRWGIPAGSRAVVGLGFGLSDPLAVEQLADAGVDVRAVADAPELSSSQFHPKLYLVSRHQELVVLSGSSNLTGGGLEDNVEQYEEFTFPEPSGQADVQRERLETMWELGSPLTDLKRSGDWEEYWRRARDRRRLEREDRRRLLRLEASAGRLIGRLARLETLRAPGYLGITHPEWWEQQLAQRAVADRSLFWRRGTTRFIRLAKGGVFFHLVKNPSGIESERAVKGFSIYSGVYEVLPVEEAWRVHDGLLGVYGLREICERLDVKLGRLIGIIHLDQLTEFDRPVTLEELRANAVRFEREIVSGRGLTLDEVAVTLQLSGLGVEAPATRIVGEEHP